MKPLTSWLKRKWTMFPWVGVLVIGFFGLMVLFNPAPKPPPFPSKDQTQERPYVIKLHAQWCPVCMLTKNAWKKFEKAASDRVNMVVLDFTTKATTESSRVEAKRLGLERFFEAHAGEVGVVYVLEGASKEVVEELPGVLSLTDYLSAVDRAEKNTSKGPVTR